MVKLCNTVLLLLTATSTTSAFSAPGPAFTRNTALRGISDDDIESAIAREVRVLIELKVGVTGGWHSSKRFDIPKEVWLFEIYGRFG